jgi:hypothetical protein
MTNVASFALAGSDMRRRALRGVLLEQVIQEGEPGTERDCRAAGRDFG